MNDVEREIRAARNQSLFRAVNERIREVNEVFANFTEQFSIACECADTACVQILRIRPSDYSAVRGHPRRFAVVPGHVYPDVEEVVSQTNGYAIVEKIGEGAEVAETLEPTNRTADARAGSQGR